MENKKIFYIGLVILASASLLVGVFVFRSKNMDSSKSGELSQSDKTKVSSGERIYFSSLTLSNLEKSLAQANESSDKKDNGSAYSDIYYFDLKSQKLEKMTRDAGDKNGYSTVAVSPDGKQIALVGFDSSSSERQIYIANKDGENKKKITSSQTTLKQLPQWSLDGKHIIFQAMAASKKNLKTGDFYKIENWNIYMTDLEGNERMVFPKAVDPKFLSDGRILSLASRGLLLLEGEDYNKGSIIWPTADGKNTNASTKIDVSKDGRYIAWAEIAIQKATVAEVDSWGPPLTLKTVKTLDGSFSFPVFSPDSKSLALMEIISNDPNTDKESYSNHRINIYDMPLLFKSSNQEIKPQTMLDLKDYYAGSTAVTSWSK